MQEAVVVAFAEMLVAVVGHVTVSPLVGLTTEVSPIVPVKSNVLVRVTAMAEPVAPVLKLTGFVMESWKSPT